eukprot:2141228-Rhodomonas_salina.1
MSGTERAYGAGPDPYRTLPSYNGDPASVSARRQDLALYNTVESSRLTRGSVNTGMYQGAFLACVPCVLAGFRAFQLFSALFSGESGAAGPGALT